MLRPQWFKFVMSVNPQITQGQTPKYPTKDSTRNIQTSNINYDRDCDDGKCPKKDVKVKGLLKMDDWSYLQPSKKQLDRRNFEFSKPTVDPWMDRTKAGVCKALKDCAESKKPKTVGKK